MTILNFGTSPASLNGAVIAATHQPQPSDKISPDMLEGIVVSASSGGWTVNFLDFPAQAEIWFAAHFYTADSTWDDQTSIIIGSANGTQNLVRIRTDTAERFEVDVAKGVGWDLVGNFPRVGSTLRRFDINVRKGVTGLVEIWEAGVSLFKWEGDNSAETSPIERVSFGKVGDDGSEKAYWSACFVADEDTRGITMVQHSLDTQGTESGFSGAVGNINDVGTTDDTTKVISAGAGAKTTYNISDMPAGYAVGYDVVAVGVKVRGQKGGVGAGDLAIIAKDGVNEVESAGIGMGTSMSGKAGILTLAPDGAAWDVAKFNAAELGFKAL